ncbi:MAG: hypothetical protein VX899_23730 [Myxococcota bacterium]|nr:hypothetical protein [Myxococcota bacterium]
MEPAQVDELTNHLVARMGGDLLTAAERAGEKGCHVLAVRFATTAWHRGIERDVAMALRLQELEGAGLGALAADEALEWAELPNAPSYAAGIASEVMGRNGMVDRALALVESALERSPDDDTLRLDRARLSIAAGEVVQGGLQAADLCVPGREMAEDAEILVLDAARALLEQDRPDEALAVLDATAPHGHRVPDICELIAQAEEMRQRLSSARRWLVHTLSLDPRRDRTRQTLSQLEDRMGIARSLS